MPKIFTRPGSMDMLSKPSLIGGKLYPTIIALDRFATVADKNRSPLVDKAKKQ